MTQGSSAVLKGVHIAFMSNNVFFMLEFYINHGYMVKFRGSFITRESLSTHLYFSEKYVFILTVTSLVKFLGGVRCFCHPRDVDFPVNGNSFQ